ncbi:CHAT domain-containing protein [Vararia minispora EC-137]|uniref:CHAT domain-containing protein n=1 Tax=Vararia minispora EC-137 TaxID=1314806 RepID=A0ACB8QB95_9AGAM|nr:CHAT domain-containing protein [Vararia minispora EC-137]
MHGDEPNNFNSVGNFFMSRFEHSGEPGDIDQATKAYTRAVDLASDVHHDRPGFLSNLASALTMRFKHSRDVRILDEAIVLHRSAVEVSDATHEGFAGFLTNYAAALLMRFDILGDFSDIEDAVTINCYSVALIADGSPEKPDHLINLANSLQRRFQQRGLPSDIEDAIALNQHALELTLETDSSKRGLYVNLANSFYDRFQCFGRLGDIESSVAACRRAVAITPDDDPERPHHLNSLGIALHSRFRHLGQLSDIDGAIAAIRDAVAFTGDDHVNKSGYLSNLGVFLNARFERLGELLDIEDAVTANVCSVALTPVGHPYKPDRLANLGVSLHVRFERLHVLGDMEDAIVIDTYALFLTPDGHPEKPGRLINLGNALEGRFELNPKQRDDIDDAIALKRCTANLIPDSHPHKHSCLYNLSISLLSRFQHFIESDDIEEAILTARRAVELTPEGHPSKPARLTSLASAYLAHLTPLTAESDFSHSFDAFRDAADAQGPPSVRIRAALASIRLCSMNPTLVQPRHNVLGMHSRVLDLIPQVVWLGHSISRRYLELQEIGDAVSAAAAAAISAGDIHRALEWLEEGKAIVWSQVQDLRSPLDELNVAHPRLAERLSAIAAELEHAGGTQGRHLSLERSEQLLRTEDERQAQRHRAAASEYEDIITAIRKLEGFESFLCPRKVSELARAAAAGPVAIIQAHETRCDALILFREGFITHVPLPRLTYDAAEAMRKQLIAVLRQTGLRTRGDVLGALAQSAHFNDINNVLSALWIWVVHPVIRAVEQRGKLPHVTWCASGPLAFLPFHAAGDYRSKSRVSAFEFVVSSYTPTLSSLLQPHPPSNPTHRSGVLIVSQPDTPGCSSLPGADAELDVVARHFQHGSILHSAHATVSTVLREMERHAYVHLACHGAQHESDPLQSAFILHDGRLVLSQLMAKSMRGANLELAVLSACQTATGDAALPDEAIHLAASMRAIGYRSVVATMWSIWDDDAPAIANAFYANLNILRDEARTAGDETSSVVAYALHDAVRSLREKVGEKNLLRWIPFVYFGV